MSPSDSPCCNWWVMKKRSICRSGQWIGSNASKAKPCSSKVSADDGFYLVESGTLSAFIGKGEGRARRVRKFSPGSLIGELSAYLQDKHRTTTASKRVSIASTS